MARTLPILAACVLSAAPRPIPAPARQAAPSSAPKVECTPSISPAIPRELEPFVERGAHPLCAHPGDLNADGVQDFVLVLERRGPYYPGAEIDNAKRSLLLVVRDPGGTLRVARRSEHVVMCSRCGGVFGDPFEGVETGPGTFTVYHYGGSAWRWRADYTFTYAPSADTWRLTKVQELTHWTLHPDKSRRTVYTTPAHFGVIDITEFHPERWNPRAPRF